MSLTKVKNSLLALGEDTSSLNLPKGTTAQRPSSPVAGMVRENTDDNVIEYYNGTEWKQVLSSTEPILVEYLVIAGGAGGSSNGGGGGAGGYLTSTNYSLNSSTQYTITVGAGGAARIMPGDYQLPGADGSNSVFDTITTIGGGGGASNADNARQGGSGGGAGATPSGTNNGGAGTSAQGFAGGNTTSSGHPYLGAGGGGASEVGGNQSSSLPGNGGDGLASSITGTSVTRAGGGGGCGGTGLGYTGPGGTGGLGGGGNGGAYNTNGTNATVNTGSGGGASGDATDSGQGGSGVVILRLLTSQYSGITTGSPTVTTDGSHTVLTYTQSGTYTA
jgi:hypothetical protein